jgi:transcriptional regulator with XRE-family HTH domain
MQVKYPNRLREYRLKEGHTQKQVAEKLRLQCEDRLSHWERGQAMPSLMNLFKLSKIYSVLPNDLFNLQFEELIRSSRNEQTQYPNQLEHMDL